MEKFYKNKRREERSEIISLIFHQTSAGPGLTLTMNGQFDLSGDRFWSEAVISRAEIVAGVVAGHCREPQVSTSHRVLPAWHRLGPAGPGEVGGGGARHQGTRELGRVTLVNYQVVAGGQLEDGLHCNYYQYYPQSHREREIADSPRIFSLCVISVGL